jgi:hypothetical protein
MNRPPGLLLDRNREHGEGLRERAADRQRLVARPFASHSSTLKLKPGSQ